MPSASIPAVAYLAAGAAVATIATGALSGGDGVKMPNLTNPADSLAKDQEAARVASADEQRLAGARSGAGSSLLQNAVPSSLLASTRKTLGAG